MQLASVAVAPSKASSLSKQRKKFKILGEHEANGNFHKQDKVKLLKFLAPHLVAAVVTLSTPISNPPVSLGETLDVHKGATLFRRSCIGCHDAGGNIIQPGATLFSNDLQRNGVDTEEEIYRVTYHGKGRMPSEARRMKFSYEQMCYILPSRIRPQLQRLVPNGSYGASYDRCAEWKRHFSRS
ncbi:cytochrome c6, chloroplastic isoform X2 [Salvia miltiorrhiza]|uniref:cytochrome c6, chloroplastic isoform X2 n=1 Tax=Salvia miltiorrhiza TaxID=226208 RepID=UPI0025AD3495|nr:cytochrome c6, chloroplastic isoform X2 [Salvia miltiorrhiza]